MRQVGPDGAAGRSAADHVTAPAGLADERGVGARRRLLLAREPAAGGGRALRPDDDGHVCVLHAAELGALAAVAARLVRLEQELVLTARDQVDLAGKLGDP